MAYELKPPSTADEWSAYHQIRGVVLWEERGIFGEYDEHHPDEYKPNHFPQLLLLDGKPIGVIRIDLIEGVAWFRRVAITAKQQRWGRGRELLRRSESFARDRGALRVESSVDGDAIFFYRKMDYESRPHDEKSMYKTL